MKHVYIGVALPLATTEDLLRQAALRAGVTLFGK